MKYLFANCQGHDLHVEGEYPEHACQNLLLDLERKGMLFVLKNYDWNKQACETRGFTPVWPGVGYYGPVFKRECYG